MSSKPRLYARHRAQKASSPLSSYSKPDVLVLLDAQADSKFIIGRLKDKPILCEVIVLSDVHALDQYYRSYDHDNESTTHKQSYLVKSDSFNEEIKEMATVNDDFYSILTYQYTLVLEGTFYGGDELDYIFNSEQRLVKVLRDQLGASLTLSDVELSSQSVSVETPRFAWFQFMFMLLSRLERSDTGMEEVNNVLRVGYQTHLKTIEEFLQTYSSDKAMEWCMKDSFYFGQVNYVLRSKDIKKIFAYRAIIQDVERNLIDWHDGQEHAWDFWLPMHVYRGQRTSKQELRWWQSHIGSVITMNSFLSTSTDKNIARCFAETFDNEDNDDIETLFTIWLDKSIAPNARFAYLYHAECDPDDHEILFSLRTLFRIDKVACRWHDEDDIWYVNMTVVDDTYEEVKRVIAPWQMSLWKKNEPCAQSLIYVRDLAADNTAFLSFQLSLDIVLRLDRNDFAHQDLLAICRRTYQHDPFILAKINRFEMTYRSEGDAPQWYTADSFLYRLLNEVLRTESVDSMFKFRYFIQDLHNQLALMQVEYLQRLSSSIVKLYRGQTMLRQDFETKFRRNHGNLIAMNSFLSTTTDRFVARAFAGDGDAQIGDEHLSVLYEITIDTRLTHSVPFAELTGHTNFEDENEVLFSMGAVFRIEGTYEEHRSLWTVQLTLTTDVDEQWDVLTEHLQEEGVLDQTTTPMSLIDYKNEETTAKRPRSRSFDAYRFYKDDFRRSRWSETIGRTRRRRFEHPAFQYPYKEI